jgi:hypothetical protein
MNDHISRGKGDFPVTRVCIRDSNKFHSSVIKKRNSKRISLYYFSFLYRMDINHVQTAF